MKVAVVGATGLVGQKMLKLLEERNFPVTELVPVASDRSIGKMIRFKGFEYPVVSMDDAIATKADVALFSAGGSTSLEHAPRFAEAGTTVIDNSSAWRMDPGIKLVVPEVNAHVLTKEDKIIANPNCSTIQLVVALKDLHAKWDIQRLVISTYQSFTGTGVKAIAQYESEKEGNSYDAHTAAYNVPIFENCIPHCDVFLENDYTKEEMKLVHETRKILGDDSIKITATAVRVPVFGGHSETVNIEFGKEFDIQDIIRTLEEAKGVVVMDDTKNCNYPTPRAADEKDEVLVGRIRRDDSVKNGLNMFVVADNLRKGAATNTIQIAEYLIQEDLL